MIKLYLTCSWDTNENITNFWVGKLDTQIYPSIILTNNRDNADYYLVFNKPNSEEGDFDFKTKQTILIRMEPFMEENVHLWGEWSTPDYSLFKSVIAPPHNLNFVEWHLTKTYKELFDTQYTTSKTKGNRVSVILSDKYQDEGQMKRIDFIKYLQTYHSNDIELDIYGRGNLRKYGIKNHLGELPAYQKDDGIIPYKYHFNCENSFSINYITEKLYDGIFGNALTFYCGAFNVNTVYPNGGFVSIDLDDFKTSAKIMIDAIKTDRYSFEQPKIQKLKINILQRCTISKRVHDIIFNNNPQVSIYTWEEIQDCFEDIVETRQKRHATITSSSQSEPSTIVVRKDEIEKDNESNFVKETSSSNEKDNESNLNQHIKELTTSIYKLIECLQTFQSSKS